MPRPPVQNAAFDAAFAGSFLSVAKTLSPNRNPLPEAASAMPPRWRSYANPKEPKLEMVFNFTQAGEPAVFARQTNEALLERCAFWENMAPFVGQ